MSLSGGKSSEKKKKDESLANKSVKFGMVASCEKAVIDTRLQLS